MQPQATNVDYEFMAQALSFHSGSVGKSRQLRRSEPGTFPAPALVRQDFQKAAKLIRN